MKSLISSTFLLFILALTIQSCGEDPLPDPPKKTAEEIATISLTDTAGQTWGLENGGSVERDGVSVTTMYEGFELGLKSVPSKTYAIKNFMNLFDASGTWSFEGNNFDKFILSGNQPAANRDISFTQNNAKLKLTFSITNSGARENGIHALAGNYTFNLIKK